MVDISYHPMDILSASLFTEIVTATQQPQIIFTPRQDILKSLGYRILCLTSAKHISIYMKYGSEVTHCFLFPFCCESSQSTLLGSNILLVIVTVKLQLTPGGTPQETHFSLALLCECYFLALLHAPLLVPYKLSLAYLTSLTSPSSLTNVHAVKRVICKKRNDQTRKTGFKTIQITTQEDKAIKYIIYCTWIQ